MSLRKRAYASFTEKLLSQEIRPGQFVTQRELVDITGLTLGAIRELIPRLEAEGLITTIPQRGMQVASLDVPMVRNAYHLRSILEVEGVRNFTQTASDREIRGLADAHQAIVERALELGNVDHQFLDSALAADWAFHDALNDALANELLSEIYRINKIRIRLIRMERPVLGHDNLSLYLSEHTAILCAMQERNVAKATAAMETHMISSRNHALGINLAPALLQAIA